jgi:hypothetical protein
MNDPYKSIEGFLPPVFNLNPEKERALFISSQYGVPEVFIENGVLKVFTRGCYYPDVSVALRGNTMSTAVTRRSRDASFGNSVATRVLRLISWLTRSSMFVVRSRRR